MSLSEITSIVSERIYLLFPYFILMFLLHMDCVWLLLLWYVICSPPHAIWLLCSCRLHVNSRCAAKQNETFALMISWAAPFCPFRLVANPVCVLSCCVSLFCRHILAPAKAALCSLWSSWHLALHAAISMAFAIQRPSQAFSSLNTCNYSQ